MIVIDTSVLFDLLKDKKEIKDFFINLPEEEFCLSVITLAELEFGLCFISDKLRIETQEKLKSLVEDKQIRLLDIDKEIASCYAKLQANLDKKGKKLSPFDGLIAATSQVYNARLLTSDVDFRRVKDLKLLFPA